MFELNAVSRSGVSPGSVRKPWLTSFVVAALDRITTRRVSEGTIYVALATRMSGPSLTRRVMIIAANYVCTLSKTIKRATGMSFKNKNNTHEQLFWTIE